MVFGMFPSDMRGMEIAFNITALTSATRMQATVNFLFLGLGGLSNAVVLYPICVNVWLFYFFQLKLNAFLFNTTH
jgi:hypothetical protein